MHQQLLLIEDVEELGRSGDVVSVRPGYARNYLLPKKFAVIADAVALRMQKTLKEKRAKQAEIDRKDAEELAKRIETITLSIDVKVDPDGHMYGSVTALDIARLMENEGIVLTRHNIVLPQPIKILGVHKISLKLKESVPAQCILKINPEVPTTP
jgi:large subunit ribosomal protein L9